MRSVLLVCSKIGHKKEVPVKPLFRKHVIKARTVRIYLKGAGGVDEPGKVIIEFSVVPDRRECQLPDAFYQIKNYCS